MRRAANMRRATTYLGAQSSPVPRMRQALLFNGHSGGSTSRILGDAPTRAQCSISADRVHSVCDSDSESNDGENCPIIESGRPSFRKDAASAAAARSAGIGSRLMGFLRPPAQDDLDSVSTLQHSYNPLVSETIVLHVCVLVTEAAEVAGWAFAASIGRAIQHLSTQEPPRLPSAGGLAQ